jgi:hypothetical protein
MLRVSPCPDFGAELLATVLGSTLVQRMHVNFEILSSRRRRRVLSMFTYLRDTTSRLRFPEPSGTLGLTTSAGRTLWVRISSPAPLHIPTLPSAAKVGRPKPIPDSGQALIPP